MKALVRVEIAQVHSRKKVGRAPWQISLALLAGLLVGCSGGGGNDSGTTPASGTIGPDKVTASASGNVGLSGGGVVLPNLATLLIPPGATGNVTVTVEAVSSSMMDNLASEVTSSFEFLVGVPKLRVLLSERPSKLVRLAIAIPNLTQLLPATHNLVVAMLQYEAEFDNETPHVVLGPVVGEVCEENTAVCVFLLPGWFSNVSESGLFQIQIGIGRAPNNPHQVTFHWWDFLFQTATAFAQQARWHLWTFTSPSPTELEVYPDESNRLHVGGAIVMESNLPFMSPPLHEALAITSDFGPRSVSGNASASTLHPAIDFRAAVGTDVFPILTGMVQQQGASSFVAICGIAPNTTQSPPLQRVVMSGGPFGELEVRYLHLSEIIDPSGTLIGRSGRSGTCAPHLHVGMHFRDEFGGLGTVDPWPLIANDITRFVSNSGDPVTPDCQGCREVFGFTYVLHVAEGRYLAAGLSEAFPNTSVNVMDWPQGEMRHVLTSEQGTFDLSQFPRAVTNGTYVLRLSLCSESIGGCRKLRDWRIGSQPILRFSEVDYSVSQTATEKEITVNRIGDSAETVTVDYTTSDGTAISGEDYIATAGTLIWNAHDTAPKTFTVVIRNNPVNTTARIVNLILRNARGAILGNPQAVTLRIDGSGSECYDPAPNVLAQVVVGDGSNRENVREVFEPSPVRVSLSSSWVDAIAGGSKGSMYSTVVGSGAAGAFTRYEEWFEVHSPGKTTQNAGTAILRINGSVDGSLSCDTVTNPHHEGQLIAGISFETGVVGEEFQGYRLYKRCNLDRASDEFTSNPAYSLPFRYSSPDFSYKNQIHVNSHADIWQVPHGVSALAEATVRGFDIQIEADPDATVRFCRRPQ